MLTSDCPRAGQDGTLSALGYAGDLTIPATEGGGCERALAGRSEGVGTQQSTESQATDRWLLGTPVAVKPAGPPPLGERPRLSSIGFRQPRIRLKVDHRLVVLPLSRPSCGRIVWSFRARVMPRSVVHREWVELEGRGGHGGRWYTGIRWGWTGPDWLDRIRTGPHESGLTGRAGRFLSHCQGEGRGFKSRRPLKNSQVSALL